MPIKYTELTNLIKGEYIMQLLIVQVQNNSEVTSRNDVKEVAQLIAQAIKKPISLTKNKEEGLCTKHSIQEETALIVTEHLITVNTYYLPDLDKDKVVIRFTEEKNVQNQEN